MQIIELKSGARSEILDITDRVREMVRGCGVRDGVVFLQSLHTTAALTINESADPDVPRDMVEKLARLVPRDEEFYRHGEGNSDSHVQTSLFGPSLHVLIDGGELVLGTWQGIFFCEWDGPRARRVAVRVIASGG